MQDKINIGLLHQVVTAELAGHRQGTAAAKSRSEVAGTGAKQWRQKGTGRARVGSGKVAHFTGGGVAFPPIPRSYAVKVNKKVQGAGLPHGPRRPGGRRDRARHLRSRLLGAVHQAGCDRPREGRHRRPRAGAGGLRGDRARSRASATWPDTRVLPVGEAEVQDYIWAKSLVFTEAAVSFLEGGASRGDADKGGEA